MYTILEALRELNTVEHIDTIDEKYEAPKSLRSADAGFGTPYLYHFTTQLKSLNSILEMNQYQPKLNFKFGSAEKNKEKEDIFCCAYGLNLLRNQPDYFTYGVKFDSKALYDILIHDKKHPEKDYLASYDYHSGLMKLREGKAARVSWILKPKDQNEFFILKLFEFKDPLFVFDINIYDRLKNFMEFLSKEPLDSISSYFTKKYLEWFRTDHPITIGYEKRLVGNQPYEGEYLGYEYGPIILSSSKDGKEAYEKLISKKLDRDDFVRNVEGRGFHRQADGTYRHVKTTYSQPIFYINTKEVNGRSEEDIFAYSNYYEQELRIRISDIQKDKLFVSTDRDGKKEYHVRLPAESIRQIILPKYLKKLFDEYKITWTSVSELAKRAQEEDIKLSTKTGWKKEDTIQDLHNLFMILKFDRPDLDIKWY